MCAALRGHAAALLRAPAAQLSSNKPAASLAMLHGGPPAWCRDIVALEPHSSVLRMYHRGRAPELTIRPVDVEALHLSYLSGDGGTALYLHRTLVGSAALRFRRHYGGDAFRLFMAETMAPWLRAFSNSRWTVASDLEKFADAWRPQMEGHFPKEGMMHVAPPPSVPPVWPTAPPVNVAKAVPKAAPKPPPKKGLNIPYGNYSNITVVLRHFRGHLATEQRGVGDANVCP